MLEVVCGIIENAEGKILACRRGLERHLGGLWEFPCGKIDAGETAEAALARELHEELGITVRVGKSLVATVEWTDGAVSIRLRGFSARSSKVSRMPTNTRKSVGASPPNCRIWIGQRRTFLWLRNFCRIKFSSINFIACEFTRTMAM